MRIVEVLVTGRAVSMSIENGTTVNVRFFNLSEYHRMDLFVRIQQTEDPNTQLRDASFSHVTSLLVSFHLYGFNNSHGILSVTFTFCERWRYDYAFVRWYGS